MAFKPFRNTLASPLEGLYTAIKDIEQSTLSKSMSGQSPVDAYFFIIAQKQAK